MSTNGVLLETLRQIPILQSLSDEECRHVGQAATVVDFPGGADVLRQGTVCQNLWVVLEGECDVVKQVTNGDVPHEVLLATLGPYENFGEMSFFQPAPHSAAVRARGTVKLLRLARKDYDQFLDHGGAAYKLAYNTVQNLAERLRRMDDWVAKLVSESAAKKPRGEWLHFRDQLLKEWNL
jgi:CRP-like cAMP-binding protein